MADSNRDKTEAKGYSVRHERDVVRQSPRRSRVQLPGNCGCLVTQRQEPRLREAERDLTRTGP